MIKFKKLRGITTRWFFGIFLPITLALLILLVVISVVYSNIYVDRVKNIADEYTYSFTALNSCNEENFATTATSLINDFAYKNILLVQILDSEGNLYLSSSGLDTSDNLKSDFEKALSQKANKYTYNGNTFGGEPVLAETRVIVSKTGKVLGGVRWSVSMKKINSHITIMIFLFCFIFIIMLVITAFSGVFFTKSIVQPIREVTAIARKIAGGSLNEKIETQRDDEVGDLCDAVNYMAAELSNTEKLKNEFISSVSHELRTPLTAIRGWGETAKMSVGQDDEIVTHGLDIILSESGRLSGLVEDLLDFSRTQNGNLTMMSTPVNVAFLLKSAADMYTEIAKKDNIDFSFSVSQDEVIVMGDGDRLKQVFVNIIDNAIKYSNAGGYVVVSLLKEENTAKIVVTDTGVGIPAQDIDRVKEKFFKSNKTVHGSGIGLAVADEIIKQTGGLLFIESTEGVGTTVTIVLPLYIPVAPDNSDTEIITSQVFPSVVQSEPEIKENNM